jgi:serine/threonine-protein kinase
MSQQLYFGPYLLVRKLGVGGMAQVWLAKRDGPGGFERVLVLKRILPTLSQDPHFVKMFLAEARLAALLNHRNIVQVFELGEIDGENYIAMEFIDGVDARTYMMACLRKDEVPDVGFAVFVMREVCTALAYAHALTDRNGKRLKLIHRDVTPANIMMARDGAVKLVDFGIAKALSEASGSTTQVGQFKGKLGYLAPEQVMLNKLDHRVDIFGAGIVLHEMLTGRRLFRRLGENDEKTLDRIVRAEVPAPSSLRTGLPTALDQICARSLAREPANRYETADEMAADLDRVLLDLRFGPKQLEELLRTALPHNAQPVLVTDEPRTDPQASENPLLRMRAVAAPSVDDVAAPRGGRTETANHKGAPHTSGPEMRTLTPALLDEARATVHMSPAVTVPMLPGATVPYVSEPTLPPTEPGVTEIRSRGRMRRRLVAAAIGLVVAGALIFLLDPSLRRGQAPASARATAASTTPATPATTGPGTEPEIGTGTGMGTITGPITGPITEGGTVPTRSVAEPPAESRPPLEKLRRHGPRKKPATAGTAPATAQPTPVGATADTPLQVERGILADPFVGGPAKK